MASLIPESRILLNEANQAPAPSKDWCQLVVTLDQIIYRWWKITPRKEAGKLNPGEVKDSLDDFLHDERMQHEVRRVFGTHTLEYVENLALGHIDFLPRMPKDLLIKIISKLDLEDIAQLSQVNKLFRELCHSNALWEEIYHEHSGSPITEELRSLAEAVGWRKLFFTNKLQLQMQLRRRAMRGEELHDRHGHMRSLPEEMEIQSVSGSEFNSRENTYTQ